MATATFIEESHAHRRGPLSVSKSSTRIAKLRRGGSAAAAVAAGTGAGAGSNQRPPPAVYKIEPEGFRSLVQELTGPNSSSMAHNQQHHQQEQQPKRLHGLAPPPISPFKPSFYTPSLSPKFEQLLSSSSPKFAFAPLTFSPLADLTPRDSVWASGLESPEIKSSSFSALIAGGDDSSKIERAGSFTFSPRLLQGSSLAGYGLGGGFSSDFNFSNL